MTAIPATHGIKAARGRDFSDREPLDLHWAEFKIPLLYLLCLSALGLFFYPAFLAALIILLNRWRKDKTEFILMLFLLIGEYGFVDKTVTGVFLWDFALVGSFFLWLAYRKPHLLKMLLGLLLFYAATIFLLAMTSIESMTIQILTIRSYLTIFCIIIPIVVLAAPGFDINVYFRKVIVFALVICAFYIVDGIILCGNVLVPRTPLWQGAGDSVFYRPIWNPFNFIIFRKYPPGLYFLMLAVYPMAKVYKMKIWQLLVVFGALICSLTFTVISGIMGGYIFLRVRLRKIFVACLLGIVGVVGLYYVDGMLPTTTNEYYQESALRIKSSVDQFVDLYNAVDDEDIAMFASGRMAQILPKFDVMEREGKMWTGIGFLHREKSKINRYIIENEYYTDISDNIEVATGIEVIPAQIIVNMGYIGLFVHTLVFFLMWYLIRRFRYASYVMTVLLLNVWFGLMGFAGLIAFEGLGILSIAYAAVLACNYNKVWGHDNKRRRRVSTSFRPSLE